VTRTAAVAPMIEVPGAQEQRELAAEYALTFTPSEDRCGTIRVGREYAIPLQAYQYDRIPQRRQRSYLSVVSDMGWGADSDGLGAIMTAFKPPEKGRGWIVRLYNPHERPVEVFLTPHKRPDKVYLVSLAEEPEAYIETDANGRACFVINPNEIVTVRFLF